jgi:hypothetical protein
MEKQKQTKHKTTTKRRNHTSDENSLHKKPQKNEEHKTPGRDVRRQYSDALPFDQSTTAHKRRAKNMKQCDAHLTHGIPDDGG